MIVRKLPTFSKRWSPKKKNNEPHRSHSDTKDAHDWKRNQKQGNKARSSTTAQKYSATRSRGGIITKPPNPNKWRNESNTSNANNHNAHNHLQSANKSPYKQTQNNYNASNVRNTNKLNGSKSSSNVNYSKPQKQRNTQQQNPQNNSYSKATQKQAHYAGTHRKLYSNASAYMINNKNNNKKRSPARTRNISNHTPTKPLPVNRKASTASNASNFSNTSSISTISNVSNGCIPNQNPHINQSQSYAQNLPTNNPNMNRFTSNHSAQNAPKHNRNTSKYNYAQNAVPNGTPHMVKSHSNHSHSKPRKQTSGYYNNTAIRKTNIAASATNLHANNGLIAIPENTPKVPHSASSGNHSPNVRKHNNNNTHNAQHKTRNERNKTHNQPHGARRRLHDIFARDKLIKWVHQKNGIYEPIFVVMEQYNDNKKVIVGRDTRGVYRLYQKRNVIESPPAENDITIINAIEQLLRGYQLRFKATSLRMQKKVEIVQNLKAGWMSPGTTNAIFANVIGFDDKNGNISNVLLQDTVHGVKDAFPVSKIQDKHTINIQENEKEIFSPNASDRKASITQYVKPSYWLNNEDKEKKQKEEEKKRKEIVKQQQGLLHRIEKMKNETNKLQEEIADKIKVIHKVDLKDKADKTGIAALNVLWTEICKRNNALKAVIETQKSETDSWRSIAAEQQNENRLLKQRMTHIKAASIPLSMTNIPRIIEEEFKDESESLQLLHVQELKEKEDKIDILSQQNTKLQRQITELQRNLIETKSKIEEKEKIHQLQLTESKLKIMVTDDSETDLNIQDYEAENLSLKRELSQIKSRQKRTVSTLSTYSTQSTHSELMQRSGGMMADSSFLTVKDTLTEFHSLRDQEYHKLHVELKKSLKSYKAKTWHKLYINEVCHRFMFEVLQLCYKYIRKYNDALYQQIGDMLCIQQIADNKAKQAEKMDYVFLFYLKENYIILFNDFKMKEMDKLIDKSKQMYSKKTQIQISVETYVLLTRYIAKCCNVCWLMILQRPKLTLDPKEFKPALKSVPFDAEKHSKTMGSDRKSSHVLYHVWPTVKNGDEKLGFNIQVIVRDSDVPQKRRKK